MATQADLVHFASDDDRLIGTHTGRRNGLPYELTYHTEDMGERKPRHVIDARQGDEHAGTLNWYGTTGTVHHIDVEPEHSRQGLATAMWQHAQELPKPPKHSADRTDQGDAWSKTVSGPRPHRSRASLTSQSSEDYRMEHSAPGPDGAPAHDLTANGVYPGDIYSHPQYYGVDRDTPGTMESHNALSRVRGKPDAKINIYRALPAEHAHEGFHPGDWVSVSGEYAREHAKHATDPKKDWPVIKARVKASEIHTNGDHLPEFGYNGEEHPTSSVHYGGGEEQKVHQHADGVVRKVIRKAKGPSQEAGYTIHAEHHMGHADDEGMIKSYTRKGEYAGHLSYSGPTVHEVHVEPEHAHLDLEERMRARHQQVLPRQVQGAYSHPHEWLPTGHQFEPGKEGLDPHLFEPDGDMCPIVRTTVLDLLSAAWAGMGLVSYGDWAKVYLAGSEASHFWGNRDFDCLIGIDYEKLRESNSDWSTWTDEQISQEINAYFRHHLNNEHAHPLWDPEEEWHTTFFNNPGSYDIRNIHPYAAYDITDKSWAVAPITVPDDWSAEKLPEYIWDRAEAVLAEVNAIRTMPSPLREREGADLFDYIHSNRRRAFGPEGSGVFDPSNLIFKFLDHEPSQPLRFLVHCKGQEDALHVTAAGEPPPLHFQYHDANETGETNHHLEAWHPEHNDEWSQAAPHARNVYAGSTWDPGHRPVASISWDHKSGEIKGVYTVPEHKRKGIASDLLRRAREIDPKVHHSDFLTESGQAWSEHTAATREVGGPKDGDSDGDFDGMMIAITPPQNVVDLLHDEEGEDAESLHITLCYLGKTDEYPAPLVAGLKELVAAWAEGQRPMEMTLQGAGTFLAAEGSDGKHVLWATVDSAGLHRVQISLVDYLKQHGWNPREDHGFLAHLTISYRDQPVRFLPKTERMSWTCTEIWVCVGGAWTSVPLGDQD